MIRVEILQLVVQASAGAKRVDVRLVNRAVDGKQFDSAVKEVV